MFRQDARSGRTNGGRSLAGAMNRSGSVHAPRRHMAHIATGIHASLGYTACRFKGERAALASVGLVSAKARLRSSGSAMLFSVQRLAAHLAKTVLTQSIKPPQAETRFDCCLARICLLASGVAWPFDRLVIPDDDDAMADRAWLSAREKPSDMARSNMGVGGISPAHRMKSSSAPRYNEEDCSPACTFLARRFHTTVFSNSLRLVILCQSPS